MSVDPTVVRFAEVLRRARMADRDLAVGALTAILRVHAPSARMARAVDTRGCSDHNPMIGAPLAALRAVDSEFDRCPTCTVEWYVTCSSSRCLDCHYPCDTVLTIAKALEAR
jgi:hypothetical protein